MLLFAEPLVVFKAGGGDRQLGGAGRKEGSNAVSAKKVRQLE